MSHPVSAARAAPNATSHPMTGHTSLPDVMILRFLAYDPSWVPRVGCEGNPA